MNFGFVIDNRKCIGCHACSTACKSENEVPLAGPNVEVPSFQLRAQPPPMDPHLVEPRGVVALRFERCHRRRLADPIDVVGVGDLIEKSKDLHTARFSFLGVDHMPVRSELHVVPAVRSVLQHDGRPGANDKKA